MRETRTLRPIGKRHLSATLHLDEKGLHSIADPDDRIAPLLFDRLPIVIGNDRTVAPPPCAADAIGKAGRRGARREAHEVARSGEDRPAERFGFGERAGDQGLVIAGQEALLPLSRDPERPEPGFEEALRLRGVRRRRGERRPCGLDQCARGFSGGASAKLPVDERAGRALEAVERRQMVVLAEAVEVVERERVEARRFRRQGRSDCVAVSRQFGSRERTSRTKVQRSTWSTTSVGEPSTTAPALSRVTEASLLANRTLI